MDIIVEKLSAGYGKIQVLWDVELLAPANSLTAIVGPNGAGKTTLLKVIVGLLKPFKGRVKIGDMDVTGLPPHQIKTLGVSIVPEGRRLFPNLTVKENLLMGTYFIKNRHILEERLKWIFGIFPVLEERINQPARCLSGGEAQMLAIGRALISKPEILIIDEPSLGLAPKLVELVFEKLRDLKKENITLLVVDQYVDRILSLADKAYIMENGRIVASGKGVELLEYDLLKKYYLGTG